MNSVYRNNLGFCFCTHEIQAESLVFVHYNLTLSHYCERAKSDRTYITWDNNPKENYLEDGALAFKCLEDELFGYDDGDCAGVEVPPPSTDRVPDAQVLPLASQPPSLRGGHVVVGRGS